MNSDGADTPRRRGVTLKAVLFMVRMQRMVGETSRKLSFRHSPKIKIRSKSQKVRSKRRKPPIFDFEFVSSCDSGEEQSHMSADFCDWSPRLFGRNDSDGSQLSMFSKLSAPSSMHQYSHRSSADSTRALSPSLLQSESSVSHALIAVRTIQFTNMSKPYTLTLLPGHDGGLIRSKPGVMVHYNQCLRPNVQRHESLRDNATSLCTKRVRVRPMRRQCTEVHEENDDTDERNRSSDGGALRKNSHQPPATQRYVRRQKSGEHLGTQNAPDAVAQRRPTVQMSKTERKKIERFKENMKELLELFTAVEQDAIGTVRSLLEKGQVDVNGENLDDLMALDVALMLNNNEVALLLLKHGAQENPRFTTVPARVKKLQTMTDNAQTKLAELKLTCAQQRPSNLSKEDEKQLSWCESRLHMLKKMRNNVESAVCPLPPRNVVLQIGSSTSLLVSFEAPEQTTAVVTRYLVEWSQCANFSISEGTLCVKDLRRLEVTIPNLSNGCTYYVRVTGGNFKGYGKAAISNPPCAIPSSWREVSERPNKSQSQHQAITNLFHDIKLMRESEEWDQVFRSEKGLKRKKPSLKNLFLASNRFHKTLKKGIYLATILYKDDKVVCTVDDNLPVILIDENEPSSLTADFNWFMKVSCCWDEQRWLCSDTNEVTNSSPSLQFRTKLTEAASQMQAALGVSDLGRLHSRPFTDSATGVSILVTVQRVSDFKSVQGLAVKWSPLAKLLRKNSQPSPAAAPIDMLASGVLDHLNFHESSYIPLDRGLYLCYMKLHASMNDISLVVPENLPSVLPFVYIRPNPHVSRDEWQWLRILDSNQVSSVRPSSAQLAFHWSLVSAARILLDDLQVSSDEMPSHRLYLSEVVEVHSDVSFILVVPCTAEVCSAPSRQTPVTVDRRGCLSLSVPVFEMAHLCTYQPDFISLYCRLSTFLDYYQLMLHQMVRRALSDTETQTLKQHSHKLSLYQTQLEEIWKSVRWITNVASQARDKNAKCGLPFCVLFAYSLNDFSLVDQNQPSTSSENRHSDASDDGADNSEGYHSDQSIEKSGSGSKVAGSQQPAVENPTYDFLQSVERPRAKSDIKNRSKTPAVYINLQPSTSSQPSSPSTKTAPIPPSISPRMSNSVSFLQVKDPRRRLLPGLERTNSDPTAKSPTSEKALSPLARSKHEYVNYPTAGQSSDSDHSSCSNRSVAIWPNAVSDTEVMSRHRCPPGEDHSLIDQLYATASQRSGTPLTSTPVPTPRPGTASPHLSLVASRATSRGSGGSPLQAGIIRVYAAYNCGLAKGTSVKLQITPKTTAREVVTLVVQQLNKAVEQKRTEGPIYSDEQLDDFCLVAVIGARERCLRDDFAPLELQNPWAKGRLFVRAKDDVLAALAFGNEAKV